jgi:hypothetical protein
MRAPDNIPRGSRSIREYNAQFYLEHYERCLNIVCHLVNVKLATAYSRFPQMPVVGIPVKVIATARLVYDTIARSVVEGAVPCSTYGMAPALPPVWTGPHRRRRN